jgi:hypothetical protein
MEAAIPKTGGNTTLTSISHFGTTMGNISQDAIGSILPGQETLINPWVTERGNNIEKNLKNRYRTKISLYLCVLECCGLSSLTW